MLRCRRTKIPKPVQDYCSIHYLIGTARYRQANIGDGQMEVRGASLISLQTFVLREFQPDGHNEWFHELPPESRAIYAGKPSLDLWYPLNDALSVPTEVLCDMFYRGKLQGAWESGRFSADFGMNTLMKVFLKVKNVHFIVKRATSILTRYYQPCKPEVFEQSENEAVIRISDFPEMSTFIEARIAGYMQRATELTGGHNVQVFIGPSLTKASSYTQFKVQWK